MMHLCNSFFLYFFLLEGVYHQYDNMIFPERKGKGRIRQTFAALKDIVTGSDPKKEELVVPNHETMQSWALETFFEQYRAILSECKISSSLNIEAATTKILHIFNSLNLLRVSNENERLFPWKCEKLSEVRNKIHQHAITWCVPPVEQK